MMRKDMEAGYQEAGDHNGAAWPKQLRDRLGRAALIGLCLGLAAIGLWENAVRFSDPAALSHQASTAPHTTGESGALEPERPTDEHGGELKADRLSIVERPS